MKRLLEPLKPRFVDQALGAEAVEAIWQLRREFSYSLRDTGLVKLNEDIVVPRGCLEKLLAFTARLQKSMACRWPVSVMRAMEIFMST